MTQAILKYLHQAHSNFLSANPADWRIWAADIAIHPSADYDRLIEAGAPPAHAVLLFKTKEVAIEVARRAKTSSLNRSAVKMYCKQQAVLKAVAKDLMELAESFHCKAITLKTQIDAFDMTLDAFEDLNEGLPEDSCSVAVPEDLELGPDADAQDLEHL